MAVKKKKTIKKKVSSKVKKTKKAVKKKIKKKASKKKSIKKKTIKKKSKKNKSAPKKAKLIQKKSTKKRAALKTKAKTVVSKSKPTNQKTISVISKSLKIGQKVPSVEVSSTNGTFNIINFEGKNVILYFYPKDHTPGCTIEGHEFTAALGQLSQHNTVVFGVSKDSLKSHKKFIEKQNYKHDLISDEDEKLCGVFGTIKEKNMYGRTYLGIDRSTFLINKNGELVAEWRGVKVKGHVDQVLAALKGL